MIKIPGTKEGLPAITEVLGAGINVNVTLIFSLDRYSEVITAWMEGLELAMKHRSDVSSIGSVASFFVSRVDVAVDALLPEGDPRRGTTANAQVAGAYQVFRRRMASERAQALFDAGAQVQRPLWASTSTKNPDVLRPALRRHDRRRRDGEHDAGRHAGRDAGPRQLRHSELRSDESIAEAAAKLDELPENVSLAAVTEKLEIDGVTAFVSAYEELLETVKKKMRHSSLARTQEI